MSHYSQTESVKQTQRRRANAAHAAHERRLQEARVRHMAAAVETSLRQQAALRRMGGLG